MTAVCFKSKNSVSTETWSNIFTGFNTDAKSCLFIKQLTSTCISTILYMRKVLPNDYFEEKSFEGMTLKILKSRKGENYVSKIEKWLEGAFEAVDKKYLKRLMLDIIDAESDMTFEIYTMTFSYNKGNEGLNPLVSSTTSFNTSGFAMSNTKLNTIKLLQMCHAVTQSYSNLPPRVKLSMRLSYYENTPEDYQPKGYVAWESVNPVFPKQARSIEIGITSTQHHFFKLFNKSCLSDKFFQDLERQLQNTSSSPLTEIGDRFEGVSLERQTKAKRELCFDNPKNCAQTSSLGTLERRAETTFVASEKCTSVSNKQTEEHKLPETKTRKKVGATSKQIKVSGRVNVATDVRSQQVRCACLCPNKTDTMFPCLACQFLVHGECYGILRFDSTKKVRFYCHLCHQRDSNLKCHDKVLMSLKSSSDQQKLSLLRRILHYCNMPGVNKITLKKMEKILGSTCAQNVVKIVLNKMVEIGVAVGQVRRKTFLIDKQALTQQLVHYFYKVQKSNSSQSQSLPYSLRTSEKFRRTNNFDAFEISKTHMNSTATTNDLNQLNSQNSQQSCDIFC